MTGIHNVTLVGIHDEWEVLDHLYPLQGQSRSEWQTVFYIAAAIYLGSAVFYLIFSSGDLQKWAMEEKTIELEELNKMEEKTGGIKDLENA